MNYFKFVNIKKVTIHKNLDPVISSHHASEIGQITDLFFCGKIITIKSNESSLCILEGTYFRETK